MSFVYRAQTFNFTITLKFGQLKSIQLNTPCECFSSTFIWWCLHIKDRKLFLGKGRVIEGEVPLLEIAILVLSKWAWKGWGASNKHEFFTLLLKLTALPFLFTRIVQHDYYLKYTKCENSDYILFCYILGNRCNLFSSTYTLDKYLFWVSSFYHDKI